MKRKILITIGLLAFLSFLFFNFFYFPLPKNHGVVDYKLFLSSKEEKPLIVGFGGSEGGMLYAEEKTNDLRDSILGLGYHFLAVGYFGTPNTPKELDRISLDAIYDTIKKVSQKPMIDRDRIAIFGGSRGGELVLNLASRYNDIGAVIAIVPSNVSLPSRFGWGETSSWTYKQEQVPFITSSKESEKFIDEGHFHKGFSKMIKNRQAILESEIKVERINSPILLISASQDEVWPSTLMCNRMMNRLKKNNFQYFHEHIELEGSHAESTRSIGQILKFLEENFPIESR